MPRFVIGVYGLVAFVVGQRRRELAIRQALGGTARHLVGLILSANVRLVVMGVVAGAGIGVLGGMALRGFLTGVGPGDPLTIAGSIGLIATAVVLASLGPAWRAAHEAPLRSLRDL